MRWSIKHSCELMIAASLVAMLPAPVRAEEPPSAQSSSSLVQSVSLEGRLGEKIWNYGTYSTSTYELIVEQPDGPVHYRLAITGEPPARTGSLIRVTGLLSGQTIQVTGAGIQAVTAMGAAGVAGQQAAPDSFGEQHPVVILMNFPEALSQPVSVAQVQQLFDQQVDKFFRDVSRNKAWVKGKVAGWITLSHPLGSCSDAVLEQMMSEGMQQVSSQVNFLDADQVTVVFPRINCGGMLGMATLGKEPVSTPQGTAKLARVWINGFAEFTIIHEFGHAVELRHASSYRCPGQSLTTSPSSSCQHNEYGHINDCMGNKRCGHYNSTFQQQLGWMTADSVSTLTQGGSGTYYITPLEQADRGGAGGIQAVQIPWLNGGKIVVEYRPNGRDLAGTPDARGAFVHLVSSSGIVHQLDMTPSTTDPLSDKALMVGQTFALPGTAISITTKEASAKLVVQVTGASGGKDGSGGGGGTDPQAPTVALTAFPNTLFPGESSKLTWQSTNADGCNGSWTSAAVPTNGSDTVKPAATQDYTVTCRGPGGTAADTETVRVLSADPNPSPGTGGLTATALGPGSIQLQWTAGSSVRAYDVRCATKALSESAWNDASVLRIIRGVPQPGTAGAAQTVIINTRLQPATTYFCGVREVTDAGVQPLSKTAQATTKTLKLARLAAAGRDLSIGAMTQGPSADQSQGSVAPAALSADGSSTETDASVPSTSRVAAVATEPAPAGATAAGTTTATSPRALVTFTDALTACPEDLLAQRRPFATALTTLTAAMDQANAQYGVHAARALFQPKCEQSPAQMELKLRLEMNNIRLHFARRTQRSTMADMPKSVYESLTRSYAVDLATGSDVKQYCAALMSIQPAVVSACQENFQAEAKWTPNDTYYSSKGAWGQSFDDLWGLKLMQTGAAWDRTKGDGVLVGVVDSGVDRTHPDLAANIWTNAKELPGNGRDDDGNGFVDDVYGWNFGDGNNDTMDRHGHGTHVSGTIAAIGNNAKGVIGVAPNAKIIPVKGLGDSGSGGIDSLASSITYAAKQGADVINNSWGCKAACPSNPIAENAVRAAYSMGAVVVFAAGNESANVANFSPENMREGDSKPVIVAASDHLDKPSNFSNFGSTVDVAAPGGESANGSSCQNPDAQTILSLRAKNTDMYYNEGCRSDPSWNGKMVVGGEYYRSRGTSMAAPNAVGVIALIIASDRNLTNEQVRLRLRQTADDINTPGFDPQSGAGRVNAAKAVQASGGTPNPPSDPGTPGPGTGVDAGADTTAVVGQPLMLQGKINLSGGSGLTIQWFKLSGSGTAQFADDTKPITTVTFSQEGTYGLRLSADDGAQEVHDDVSVRVNAAGSSPGNPAPPTTPAPPSDPGTPGSGLAITSKPPTRAYLQVPYEYAITTSGGSGLIYSLPEAPENMTVSAAGAVAFIPDLDQLGDQSVRVLVTDAGGSSAEQRFTITVKTGVPLTTNTKFKQVAHVTVPGMVVANWTYGNYVLLTDDTNNLLRIYDISTPSAPRQVSSVPIKLKVADALRVYRQRAYVPQQGDPTCGVLIVNIEDPTKPWIEGKVCGTISGVDLRRVHSVNNANKGYLYASPGPALDLAIIDVRAPANPTVVSVYAGPQEMHEASAAGDRCYLSEGSSGTYALFDVKDPSKPTLLGRTQQVAHYAHDSWPSPDGKYLWATDELATSAQSQLNIFDITNPASPRLVKQLMSSQYIPSDPATIHRVHFRDQFVFNSHYAAGVVLWNATDPGNPTLQDRFDTYTPGLNAASYGFTGRVSMLPDPVRASHDDGTTPNGFAGAVSMCPFGKYVTVGDMNTGLWVLDLTNPAADPGDPGQDPGPSPSPGDTARPTVSIASPTANATVSGSVHVEATATDDVGVIGVQFSIDGAALGPEVTGTHYHADWDTTAVADGSHRVAAVARDAAGNQGRAEVTVTVNNGGASPPPNPAPNPKPSPNPSPNPNPPPPPPAPGDPTLSMTANPATINRGQSSTLSWTSTKVDRCTGYNGFNGDQPVQQTGIAVSPLTTTTYQLFCENAAGGQVSDEVTVTVVQGAPGDATGTLTASPNVAGPQDPLTVTWNVAGATTTSDWIGLYNTVTVNNANRLEWFNTGGQKSGSKTITPRRPLSDGTYEFRFFVGASLKHTAKSNAITISAKPAPTLTFTAHPTTINPGQSSTLTWSSANAVTCRASNGWDGLKPMSGTATVTPTKGTAYVLTCLNAANLSVQRTVVVKVTGTPDPNPGPGPGPGPGGDSVFEFLSPTAGQQITGTTVQVSYRVTGDLSKVSHVHLQFDAQAEVMDTDFDGAYVFSNVAAGQHQLKGHPVDASHQRVGNEATVSFSTGASDPGPGPGPGPNPQPGPALTLLFGSLPEAVNPGMRATLVWIGIDATGCTASGPSWTGARAATGSEEVTPAQTGTYTMSCRNAAGETVSKSVTITVRAGALPPGLIFGAIPERIASGQTSDLMWFSSEATSCQGSNSWSGAKDLAGSQAEAPTKTTTYTLTCTAANAQTITKDATITVDGTSPGPNPGPGGLAVTITKPADGSRHTVGEQLTAEARVTPGSAGITTVDFFEQTNHQSVGTATKAPYRVTFPLVNAGNYALVAKVTDAANQTAESPPVRITVAKAGDPGPGPNPGPGTYSVAITRPKDGAHFTAPAAIVIEAAVTGSPLDKVELFGDTQKLGDMTGPPYRFTWSNAPVGTHRITVKAIVSGSPVASDFISVTVSGNGDGGGDPGPGPGPQPQPKPPTVAITKPADKAVIVTGQKYEMGQFKPVPVTIAIEASVTVDAGASPAKVEYFNGPAAIGSSSTAPKYAVDWKDVAPGTYTLTAKVTDARKLSATSKPITVTVRVNNKPILMGAPSIKECTVGYECVIAVSATDPDGDRVTLSLERMPSGAGFDPASGLFFWYPTSDDTYTMTFVATDEHGAADRAMVIIHVEKRAPGEVTSSDPRVSLLRPRMNDTFDAGKEIEFEAVAAVSPKYAGGGRITAVEFWAWIRGGAPAKVATASSEPWTATWRGAAPGTYEVYASAFDDRGNQASSSHVHITVRAGGEGPGQPGNKPPTVKITAPADGATYLPGLTIAITATATDPDGGVAKLELFDGSTRLKEFTAAPYEFAWSNAANGAHVLTAKATDDRGLPAVSAPVTITVGQEPQAPALGVRIVSPQNQSTFTAPATIELVANLINQVGGTVEFFQGTTKLGDGALSADPYKAYEYRFVWKNVGVGDYVLTAKAKNTNATATSPAVAITVVAPSTTPNPNPTVRITKPAAGASIKAGQRFDLEAQITGAAGSGVKVDFYKGADLIGTAAAAPYVASGQIDTPGSYTLTAKLSNSGGVLATSSPVMITITASTPNPNPGPGPGGDIQKVLDLVNQERAKVGALALRLDDRLNRAAQKHSDWMARTSTLSHTGENGSTFTQRIAAEGYSINGAAGENVAGGQPTPEAVMAAWMSSPGHRANILNASYRDIGIGVARGGSFGIYWTQDFASGSSTNGVARGGSTPPPLLARSIEQEIHDDLNRWLTQIVPPKFADAVKDGMVKDWEQWRRDGTLADPAELKRCTQRLLKRTLPPDQQPTRDQWDRSWPDPRRRP